MMRLSIAVSLLVVFMAGPALAERPTTTKSSLKSGISPGELAPTPEMWFYERYDRDYKDPKMAVRQKAEFRTRQRLRRLAAMKWFGFSNQRPVAFSDPFHWDYSPRWSSNNGTHPFQWNGIGRQWVYMRPDGSAAH